jgi:hydroxyacylglutathione hydrolase
MSTELVFKQFVVGHMANFNYLIGDRSSGELAVIDPAWDANLIKQKASELNMTISMIILTHGHPDHIEAIDQLTKSNPLPIYISADEPQLFNKGLNTIRTTIDQQLISIGGVSVKCVHTPGHTPGSQCLQVEEKLITGDTLFINACGRCDLPGGDPATMYDTLYTRLLPLNENLVIYPGHQYGGRDFDTLKNQKITNPYLTCSSKEEFLRTRM